MKWKWDRYIRLYLLKTKTQPISCKQSQNVESYETQTEQKEIIKK